MGINFHFDAAFSFLSFTQRILLLCQRRGISTDSSAFPFSQREKKSTIRQ